MGKLVFKVASDWEEVVRLRNEIEKLKQTLKGIDAAQAPASFNALNTKLSASTQELNGLVSKAAQAGAVMEGDFKKKIFDASQGVNGFTEKIIAQKAVVKDVEADVKRLGEAYRTALKRNPLSANSKLAEYTSAKKALDEDKAALFNLTQQQAEARLSVKKLRDEYSLYKDDAKDVTETNEGIAISWKKALSIIGGVTALKAFGSEIIRVRGEFQSMQTAIETLVGKDVAGGLIPQIKEMAKVSPLTLTDFVGAEKMMLGFNIEADKTIGFLRSLSDISMGDSQKFNSLTLAFSQMSAAGKLMGQDLNQMINAGFNPLQQISEKTGKSIATLKDEMSKGAISAEMVQQAFIDATSAGGKFFGMSENASKTINGQISMMQDAMDEAFNEMGQKSEGFIMSAVQGTTSLIQNYETVGKVLAGLVITYGAYRAAVMLVTAAESSHTLVEIGLTNARILARKAQLALNAAMLTNPYVLLAVAVAGLGTAMWAFHDSSTEAEKAQKRFNERQEEAAKQEQEHKQRIDELVNSSRDIALADLQRGQSLAELRKEYPKIFEKYDIETIKLADILKLKQQIAEEDTKRAGEKKAKEFSDIESEIKYYENLLKSLSGQQGVDGYVKKLKQLRLDRDAMLQDKGKGISEQFISTLKDIDVSGFDRYISELEKRIKGKGENGTVKLRLPIDIKGSLSDEAMYNVKDIRTLIDTAKSTKQTRIDANKNKTTYKQDLDKAKKDWESAKAELKKIEDDKSKFTTKQYEEAKKRSETTEKTYKDLGGVTGSSLTKQENQADKLRQQQEKYNLLLDKQALDQKRSAEDMQNQVDEARIKAMKDGNVKTLSQMELNHKKEIQQLDRQQEDLLRKKIDDEKAKFDANEDKKAASNSSYKRKTFDGSNITLSRSEKDAFDNQRMYLGIKQSNETQAYLDKERQAWNDYLAEYGAFQEKKDAITSQYNEKISNASTKGEKESLKKEKESKLKEVNFNELKSSINFADIFGNLDAQSTEAIKVLRDKLKDIINKSAKDLNPTDLKSLQDALGNIDLKMAERDPFGELKEGIDKYKTSTQAVIKAQEDLNTVQQGGDVIVGTYLDKTGKICTKLLTQEQAEKNLSDAQRSRLEAQSKFAKSVNSLGEQGQQVVQAGNDLVDMLTSLGVSVPDSVKGALDGVGQVMDSMASIDLMKPMSILTGITGTLAGLGKAIGSIFGLGKNDEYDQYAKMKEHLNGVSKVWDDLIDKKKEYININVGKDAYDAEEEALSLIEKKQQENRDLANKRLQANEKNKHSYGKRMWSGYANFGYNGQTWEGVSSEIKEKKGIDIGYKLSNMANLTAEQLEWIKENYKDLWANLDGDYRAYLENVINGENEKKEVIKAGNEAILSVSLESFSDCILNSLYDIKSTANDISDDISDYMRKALIKAIYVKNYQSEIEDWYKKWKEYMSDGILDDNERNDLDSTKKDLIDKITKDVQGINEMFDYSSSQSSTTKGFEAMSQDTGEELNGRFTALQVAGEEIKNQNILQTESLNLLTAKASDILSVNTDTRNIADEIRTIQMNSYLELQDIRENTGNSAKYLKDIKEDISEVKNNTKGLSSR